MPLVRLQHRPMPTRRSGATSMESGVWEMIRISCLVFRIPSQSMAVMLWALLLCLAGCAHPCPNIECDWADVYRRERIPPSLEFDAADAVIAPIVPSVLDPAT